MNAVRSDTETVQELPASIRNKMIPVATFNPEPIKASNLVDLEYHVDLNRPCEVLPFTDLDSEDETIVEVLDPKLLCVKQIGPDGEPHIIVLSPAQLVHLIIKTRSYVGFPNGVPNLVE